MTPSPPQSTRSHAGDDDYLNEHLRRPATRQATGYDENYEKQRVKPRPELGLMDDENTPMYAKGGPVGAKKIRNKGYRPF